MDNIWNPLNWFGGSDDTAATNDTQAPAVAGGFDTFATNIDDLIYSVAEPHPEPNNTPAIYPEMPTNNASSGFFGGIGNFLGVPNLGGIISDGLTYKIGDELGLYDQQNKVNTEDKTPPKNPEAPEAPLSDVKFYAILGGVAIAGGIIFTILRR